MNEETPLISAKNLSVHFGLGRKLFGEKKVVRAVENISLDIPKGSFFGLVGESGSGKTTLGRAILRAAPITNGTIAYNDGEVDYDVASLNKADLKDYRTRASVSLRDAVRPMTSRGSAIMSRTVMRGDSAA